MRSLKEMYVGMSLVPHVECSIREWFSYSNMWLVGGAHPCHYKMDGCSCSGVQKVNSILHLLAIFT